MSDRDTSAGPRFDPRFPPAFQPGYDERVHREEPPRVPLREAPRTDLDDLIAAAAAAAADSNEERLASDPAFDHGDETPDAAAKPAPAQQWWKRINPYLVALGLIGVALLVAAWNLAFTSASGTYFSSPSSEFDPVHVFFLQSAIFTVPLLGSLGLAALISIVVILATRWRR
jgi:hypothetical protein